MSALPAPDRAGPDTSVPDAPEPHRLCRSRHDSVFGGVCGGLARYLGVDPLLLRVAAAALVRSGGIGPILAVAARR